MSKARSHSAASDNERLAVSIYRNLAQAWGALQRCKYRRGDVSDAAVQEFLGVIRRAMPINDAEQCVRHAVLDLLAGSPQPATVLHRMRRPGYIVWLPPAVLMRELRLADRARLDFVDGALVLLPARPGAPAAGKKRAARGPQAVGLDQSLAIITSDLYSRIAPAAPAAAPPAAAPR